MIELTPAAVSVLRRSLDAARRFNPSVIIRLVASPAGLASELAETPAAGDTPVQGLEGAVVAAPGVRGTVDVQDPHDQLVLRPSG